MREPQVAELHCFQLLVSAPTRFEPSLLLLLSAFSFLPSEVASSQLPLLSLSEPSLFCFFPHLQSANSP